MTGAGVRAAIVGCGFIGGVHSRALRGLFRGGVVDGGVVAVCDQDLRRAGAFAAAHGAGVVTTDPDTAMAAADAVWICTPTSTHRALVERAVARRVAIYCEKPLATSLVDAAAMTDAVIRSGVTAQVGLVLRASTPLAEMARLVQGAAEGAFGRAMTATLRDDQYFPIQGQYQSTWRSDAALSGGGTLIEHSIHDLDVLAWILGPVVEVTARTANFAGHPGVEDVATVTLAHAGGAISMLASIWHGMLARATTRRIEVFCERALLWLDDEEAGPVHVEQDAGVRSRGVSPDEEALLDRLAVPDAWRRPLRLYALADLSFLRGVASGRGAGPGFEDALAAHVVADAAYRSAAHGSEPTPIALL